MDTSTDTIEWPPPPLPSYDQYMARMRAAIDADPLFGKWLDYKLDTNHKDGRFVGNLEALMQTYTKERKLHHDLSQFEAFRLGRKVERMLDGYDTAEQAFQSKWREYQERKVTYDAVTAGTSTKTATPPKPPNRDEMEYFRKWRDLKKRYESSTTPVYPWETHAANEASNPPKNIPFTFHFHVPNPKLDAIIAASGTLTPPPIPDTYAKTVVWGTESGVFWSQSDENVVRVS